MNLERSKTATRWVISSLSLLLTSSSLYSAAIVYEGFDYTSGTDIPGQGAVVDGWSGAWTETTSSSSPVVWETVSGLSFGALEVTGGAAQRTSRTGNAAMTRSISASSQAALTGDDTTIWFSVLMAPTGGDGNGFALNTYATLVFGNAALTGGSGNSAAPITVGGDALGVSFASAGGADFANMTVQGVTYRDGVAVQAGSCLVGEGTSLIVGKIDWAANGSDDTLTLYNILDPTAALPASFVSMSVDFDQSDFNVISVGDSQTSVFDEIRLGSELADVLPVPEPSSLTLLALSSVALLRRRAIRG
ncbi:MAG: PEP-CTERM sorting domain-containing protein [Verrucomicrobiales bacterium]